ncbi:MAG TPA: sugar ABC transporter permease [Rectinemataceae bacterium]|nr:sugar ABC transporter permease [Rectinemataceae bacterium]
MVQSDNAGVGSEAGPRRKGRRRDPGRRLFVFLCLLPAFFFLAVFLYYPIVETFRISTMRTAGLGQELYVGFDNYAKLFANDEFQAGLVHVFQWAFWSVIVQLPLAFAIAFALTWYGNRLTGFLRAAFYLSNVLPSAITAMLGKFIFAPNYGIVASFANLLHWKWLGGIDFLGDPKLAFWSIFAVATWAYTGFPIIYLMARIEQIPRDVREAAMLDGASPWRYATRIVLPETSYPLRILAVLCTVGSLKLFDLPNMMTSGGPGNATVTLGITLYRHGFVNWNYGKAAAIGAIIFALSLVFTVLQFSIGRKKGEGQ